MARLLAGLVLAASLPALSACGDLLFTEPGTPDPVVVDFSPLLQPGPAGADVATVLGKATAMTVRLFDSQTEAQILEETVSFPGGGAREARIEVPIEGESQTVRAEIDVLFEGSVLFTAVETFTLTRGRRTEVDPELDPEIASVEVSPVPTVTALGEEITVEASALYATGDVVESATFTFTSSDPEVLEHLGGGRFRVVGEGSATVQVTATAGELEVDPSDGAGDISVEVAPEVSTLQPNATELRIPVGGSAGVTVQALDANGNELDRQLSFVSRDPAVATITVTGPASVDVRGESPGTTRVTASFGGVSVDVDVTVFAPVATLEADPPSITVEAGASANLTVTARDADGNELSREIDFESEDPGVATVSPTGQNTATVTGVADGSTRIVASAEGVSVTIDVTVGAEVEFLEATPSSISVEAGSSASVEVVARDVDENVLSRDITFESLNPAVATVASTGQNTATVTGVAEGSTTVVASADGVSLQIPVTVTAPLGTGDVQVTLTWNTTADIDLWVTDPFGERVWFANTTSASGGQLDRDDLDGFGPENIFWPEDGAPGGTYVVEVNYFSSGSPSFVPPTDFEVRVQTPDGTQTFTGTLTMVSEIQQITTFTISGASCAIQASVTAGQTISGTLPSSGGCTFNQLPSDEVALAYEFSPVTERVSLEITSGSVNASLWRAGAGFGGRAGLIGAASMFHLHSDRTYTVTVRGQPGTSFTIESAREMTDELPGGGVIQWSEPVTGRMLSITSSDFLNASSEREDVHFLWPRPGEIWEVTAESNSDLRRRGFGGDPDEIAMTLSATVFGETYANSGFAFPVASFQNQIPQDYTFTITGPQFAPAPTESARTKTKGAELKSKSAGAAPVKRPSGGR